MLVVVYIRLLGQFQTFFFFFQDKILPTLNTLIFVQDKILYQMSP